MYELDKHESLWHIWTSSDDAVMMSGATILSELARNNCSRSALVKPNILNQILRLVSPSKSLSVTSAYLKALALLAGYDDTRSAILESNFLDSVGKILSSGDPSVILVTVETLFKLSVNDDKKRDYVNQLMERIQSTDKQTWSSCFNGLKFLANQGKHRLYYYPHRHL
ncbi:hypothetical protein PILCRDRAFT_491176 [Piloderma croceum F 1598]|uniref:Uncharacterized protein n=1 Tax=Piloderma croceum (strain F 1598) TaxID=765440 RepID=A0A0C3FRP1_PILCF|nr:hypothetical protein PILCRDRAFT_491176 [Piloderma croceum F 1598]